MTDERADIKLPRFADRIGVLQPRDWLIPTDTSDELLGVLEPFAGVLQPVVRTGDWPFIGLSYLALGPLVSGIQSDAGRRPARRHGGRSDESKPGSSIDPGRDKDVEGRPWHEAAVELPRQEAGGSTTFHVLSPLVVRPAHAAPRDGGPDSSPDRVDGSRPRLTADSRPHRGRTGNDRAERPNTDASNSSVGESAAVPESGAVSGEFDPSALTASRDLTSVAGGVARETAGNATGTNALRGRRRSSAMTVLRTSDLGDAGGDASSQGGSPGERPAGRSPNGELVGEATTEPGAIDRPTTGRRSRTDLGSVPADGDADRMATGDRTGRDVPESGIRSAPTTDTVPRLTVRSRGPTPGGEPERTPGGPRVQKSPDFGGRSETVAQDDDAGRRDGVERSVPLEDAFSGSAGGDVDRIVDRLYGELQRRIRIERERRGR